jgi:predicted amidohydrolase YtcJ
MGHADYVLLNGRVFTMNPVQHQAEAVAIRDGRFVAVGSDKEILSYVDQDTEVLDLDNRAVVPGFIDSHVHGASLGRSTSQINLRVVKSIIEIRKRIMQRVRLVPKGDWIIGRGWDQDKLIECRYPSRDDLDTAAPENPVLLLRVCGHLAVVNSAALKLAGITKNTDEPQGGYIEKDPRTGEPNGVLRENSLRLVFDVLPESTEKSLENTCLLACRKMVEQGITTAHWIVNSAREIRLLQALHARGLLPLRIYLLIPTECMKALIDTGLTTGFGDDRLKIGAIKIMMDGSLGARTAALRQPYNDDPETHGMLLHSKLKLKRFVEEAHKAGLQLAIHTIGDRTVQLTLDVLEEVLSKYPRRDHRHRLEHASVLDAELIREMKEVGVIASVQPHFIVSDVWINRRLGAERTRWTYSFRSLLKAGITAIAGSDAPVEPASPLLGIYAAVTRETVPQERLSMDEALSLYTATGAHGSFEEDVKGTIEKGKLADLVVLSRDPYEVSPQQIKEIQVELTIVGGRVVYARK